jgi:hypothetical protein
MAKPGGKPRAKPKARKMGSSMSKAPTPDAYEKELSPANRKVVRALRAFVHEQAPELRERMMWGGVAFIGKGNVCFAHALDDYVAFGFFNGAALHDPHKVLEGKGKFVRTVKVAKPSDIRRAEFAALLKQALALQ